MQSIRSNSFSSLPPSMTLKSAAAGLRQKTIGLLTRFRDSHCKNWLISS
jgi:hypothetical protein